MRFGPVTQEFYWRVYTQDDLHVALRDAFRFTHIRQTAPIVDADANSLVSVGEYERRVGSRMGGATAGCGGDIVPPPLRPRGYRGVQ